MIALGRREWIEMNGAVKYNDSIFQCGGGRMNVQQLFLQHYTVLYDFWLGGF
jgi:hypothetical protein